MPRKRKIAPYVFIGILVVLGLVAIAWLAAAGGIALIMLS